ncbi:MAG: amidohydrolase family protein, partial [Gemmatimonadota bacterium]
ALPPCRLAAYVPRTPQSSPSMLRRFALLGLGAVTLAVQLAAQVPRTERRRWIDSTTSTTDDPRRVPLPEYTTAPEGSIVLRGGRLWDGTGAAARPATVVIQRNRIAAVLAPGAANLPTGATIIEVGGKTIMPGLIDLHTHLDYQEPGISNGRAWNEGDAALRGMERLRYYIESGITTVRDVASMGDVPFTLKRWVTDGRIIGPRIFAAGAIISGLGGHGAEVDISTERPLPAAREAHGPDDWREAVREQFRKGADLIKVSSHFSDAEIKAAVDEAHDLGLKITADAETFYIERAVRAGIDMIEHPLPRTDETIRLMAERKVESDPTLVPYQIIFDQVGGYWGSSSRRFTFSRESILDMLKRLKGAGVKLGIGTDLVSNWFRYLPWPYHQEMRNFMAAGFSLSEVLQIATRVNAEMLDMGDRLGTIQVGKLADVLVVDGKPDERLEDLGNVDTVIRDGRIQVRSGQTVYPRHQPVTPPGRTGEKRVP